MKPLTDYLPADRIHADRLSRLAYAHDASLYRLIPAKVVKPRSEREVQSLLAYCRELGTHVTFRTGGTSLSGQAVTDGILADVTRFWMNHHIGPDGRWIDLQPGLVGDQVNRLLQGFERRIGPDPASIKAARIGGIVNNNASGMCCGTAQNSYHTLQGVRFILANSHLYDTRLQADYHRFAEQEETLARGLTEIREQILARDKLVRRIRDKYRIKNTLGYSMNAFLDYSHPLDIFAHLLVGSEGTLAFLSEVRLKTVPDPPEKMTGLVLFPSLEAACTVLPELVATGASAVELMDYASLTTARYLDHPPFAVDDLDPDAAAFLIEYQGNDSKDLENRAGELLPAVERNRGMTLGGFQADPTRRDLLWKLRKGLYPTVGSLRKVGTSVITEDIAYPLQDLPRVVRELHGLFQTWHFEDAIVFGHAKDGNLHFVTSIDLESRSGVRNYEGLMDGLVDLTTVRYPGSLKAEHGTGRNMAPFVINEWGPELTALMWKLKELADPDMILNPGVLLNRDDKIHLKHLKPIPPVDTRVDQCVECGFCEPVCPSQFFTTTPRQRIALKRELALLPENGEEWKELAASYDYAAVASCAADSLCELACPVNIDTGLYMKSLREQAHSRTGRALARWSARHFSGTQVLVRTGNRLLETAAAVLGKTAVEAGLGWVNRISGERIPSWSGGLKTVRDLPLRSTEGNPQAVYYPSCLSRTFTPGHESLSLVELFLDITRSLGREVSIPTGIRDTCCGTPFSSKGYREAARIALEDSIRLLYQASNQGELPIVVDTSPCTWKFTHPEMELTAETRREYERLRFVDILEFLWELVSPLSGPPLPRKVALHPTCSTQKFGQVDLMVALARHCAREVVLPPEYGCCGMAGDRGLLHPGLTRSGTEREARALREEPDVSVGLSSSRTCEEGLSRATGLEYTSILRLVADYVRGVKHLT